ncbi:hypothetical protein K883_05221 [Mycobacterium sp. TKK-01-0059]|uniref:hypothetical protein n=1 Tax=Mycobacterium sp. TKK-01-0059 TaxID=1324269 RepID=UPI0004D48D5C|nr:hypothetical protein [Mycobacterium sp. TKK-01-0059]KEF95036.1 hypothetical protein K883_05221 [Mycobacterium sp. TKK-01-0059]
MRLDDMGQPARIHCGQAPKPPNRNLLGACLALLAMVVLALVILLLFNELSSPVFGVKLGEGYFPDNSAAIVHSARIGVLTSTGLIVVATGLAASAVAVRPHPFLQVVAVLTLVSLIPLLLLLLFCYALAF